MSTSTATSGRTKGALRSTAAVIVLIVAMVLTPLALVGHWGHRTVTDTEAYIATVGPLIEQPEVQKTIADAATNAIVAQVDTTSLVSGLLDNLIKNPSLNSALSAPISAGINSLIGEGVSKVVASDAFAAAWIKLNTAAQKSLMLILEGKEGDVVTLQGDDVVLDITPLLTGVQQALVDKGFTVAANVQIPDNTASYVLFSAPGLAQLRMIYSFASPIFAFFPLLLAAMFALAVWLSRRRGAMTVAVGIGFGAMTTLTGIALNYGQTIFTDKLQGTILAPVTSIFWTTFFKYLSEGLQAMTLLAIIVLIAGLLGLRAGWAARARAFLASGPAYAGARIGLGGIGSIVARNARAFRYGAIAAGLLILTLGNVLSMAHVIWTALLTAGLFAAIEMCIGSSSEVIEIVEVEVDVPLL